MAIDHSYTPQNPRIDKPFTLRTTVVNDGTETVSVRVQHTVAPELDITSMSEGCAQDDQWIECEVGELVSGESFVMTFELLPRVWGRWTVTGSAIAMTPMTPIPTTLLAEQTVFIEVSQAFNTSFTIERPPWPGVTITAPENGGEFIEGSPIQLRYTLEYNDVATGPQDFLLRINGDQEEFLEHNDSRLLNDLPSGTHTIEIRYKDSEQPDATVTFTVLANNEPGKTSKEPDGESGSGNSGGGGRLDWLAVMVLAILVSINGLRITAKRC